MTTDIMLQDGVSEPYLGHLIGQSHKAIEGVVPSGSDVNQYTKALEYLASIDLPQARETLEMALQSKHNGVVEYAAVNLLFNQTGGYDSVKQLLMREFDPANVKNFRLGVELKWHLATVLSDDPEIRQVAQAYSQRTGLFYWEYYVVERKGWPIYNWVGNYVVKLNSTKPKR